MNVKSIREDKENFNKTTYKYSIPLAVKRKISVIDHAIQYLLEGVYGTRRVCVDYAGYDEFIQVMSEGVAEKMYLYHFSHLDDLGKEWEKNYYGIMEYIDIAWGDRLEEHFESICNKGEIIKEEKINNFINSRFDKVFNKLKLNFVDDRGTMYGKWYNEKNEDVFHRNHWGTFWVIDCETYRELRSYSKLIGLDLDEFEKFLIEYLNDKYREEFFLKPIKRVGDESNCLEEY